MFGPVQVPEMLIHASCSRIHAVLVTRFFRNLISFGDQMSRSSVDCFPAATAPASDAAARSEQGKYPMSIEVGRALLPSDCIH